MKNQTKLILGLSAALLAQATQATPITGVVDINGTATLNGPLGTATSVLSVVGAHVDALTQTGAYLGTDGASVTMTGFSWSPTPSTDIDPLWTFTAGPDNWVYSFDLSSLKVVSQTPSFLDIEGIGSVTIIGNGSPYTETDAMYTFTISQSGPKSAVYNFGFDSETSAVPDGGTTVALLGSALGGLSMLRRKIGA